MWRALFLSIGLTLIFIGLQCLVVEQVVVKNIRGGNTQATNGFQTPTFQNASYQTNVATQATSKPKYRLFKTKEWMPWSLLAAGFIVVIYTFSLPRRSKTEENHE